MNLLGPELSSRDRAGTNTTGLDEEMNGRIARPYTMTRSMR